jgi:hypothetical protein
MIFLVALCQAAVALAWIRVKDFGARAPFVAAAAFLGTTVLALAAEHPPAALLAAEIDRLSLPHAVVAALCCAVWGAAWTAERQRHAETPARRAALIGAAGAAGMLVLAAAFPALVAGPFSQVDPRVLRIWDARVGELDTLVPTDLRHAGNFLYLVGAAVPCLVYAWAMAWRRRNDALALPWMLAALLLAGYLLLALRHVRVAPFAEIAAAPVLAEMISRLLDWSRRQVNRTGALLQASAAAFLLTAGGLVAGSHLLSRAAPVADAIGAPAPQCRISRVAPVLNDPAGLGATPLTVAALLDHGPEILYRTQHAVVGAPFHRNGAGIWDSYRLFAASEEAESRDIAARRRIGLLLVCPSRAERLFFTQETGRNNLYTRLLDGTVPAWLAPVPMEPQRADGFRLYRVVR